MEVYYKYFGARYYNSDISVWLSVDPLADKYPMISPYAYVFNNPLNMIDRWGLEGEPNKYDRRLSRKIKRFERTGKTRHANKITKYVSKHKDKLGIQSANFDKDKMRITLKYSENIRVESDKNTHDPGTSIPGGGAKIKYIKGQSRFNPWKGSNIAARIRDFDRNFDGRTWKPSFRRKFYNYTVSGVLKMTRLVFPGFKMFERFINIGRRVTSDTRQEPEKDKNKN